MISKAYRVINKQNTKLGMVASCLLAGIHRPV